jgi:hypothetical protein
LPLFPAETGELEAQPELLRYAQDAQGLLAHRDPELLRRYILDSCDTAEQTHRQIELFVQSTTRMALGSNAHCAEAPRHQRIVQTGFYAWPVAICMAQNLRVRSHFHFDVPQSIGLKAELALAWASALGIAASDIALHGVVDVRHLAGVTPLALQSFMRKSTQGKVQYESSLHNMGAMTGAPATDEDPWALLVAAQTQLLSAVGPNNPVAFLLTAFVSWDHDAAEPVWRDPHGAIAQRLQALLQALFSHVLPSPVGPLSIEAQAPIRAEVRLGQPSKLHDAITQAQWMQLAWLAERARKTDCSFRLDHRQDVNVLTWSASLSDEFESEIARVGYSYDGFWRPASHVQTVIDQVSLAQATGQMRTDSTLAALPH